MEAREELTNLVDSQRLSVWQTNSRAQWRLAQVGETDLSPLVILPSFFRVAIYPPRFGGSTDLFQLSSTNFSLNAAERCSSSTQ